MTAVGRFPLGQVAITANASLRLTTEEMLWDKRRDICQIIVAKLNTQIDGDPYAEPPRQ